MTLGSRTGAGRGRAGVEAGESSCPFLVTLPVCPGHLEQAGVQGMSRPCIPSVLQETGQQYLCNLTYVFSRISFQTLASDSPYAVGISSTVASPSLLTSGC